ncbi:AmmeMemoRadiSam system radical SAM enzyme [Bacteroidota bacterium]
MNKRNFLKYGFCAMCSLGLTPLNTRLLGNILPEHPGKLLADEYPEAMYYINTPKGLKCKICPQACDIKENETGDCRTRLSRDGKLYTTAYGNPCAINIDPIEKKPLYHFLPESKAFSIATAGCNLACLNCQNWTISQISPRESRNYDLPPEKVIQQCIGYECKSIAYTYSEPVVFYEYTLETSKIAHLNGLKNVFISAGYINEVPLRDLSPFLDAANIDLKSFSNEIYEMLNAGTLEPVLNTLKILKEEGVWLEITNLVVPSWTDDMDMIKKMCDWLYDNGFENNPLHFSRFHPMYKLKELPPTPYESLHKAREIALNAGINYVYIGNVPDTDAENTFCPGCKKTIIDRKGYHILENKMNSGKCGFCETKIAGVWE